MKRLFEVNGTFFDKKSDAKNVRGAPTKPADGKKPPVYAHPIKKGPDHWRSQ